MFFLYKNKEYHEDDKIPVSYGKDVVEIPMSNFYWLNRRGHIRDMGPSLPPRVSDDLYLELIEQEICQTTVINRDKAYE